VANYSNIKIIVSPFGKIFNPQFSEQIAAYNANVCNGFQLNVPSCEHLQNENRIQVAYSYVSGEYSLFFAGGKLEDLSGPSEPDPIFNVPEAASLTVNGQIYDLVYLTEVVDGGSNAFQVHNPNVSFEFSSAEIYNIDGLLEEVLANPSETYTATLSLASGCELSIEVQTEQDNPCFGPLPTYVGGSSYNVVAIGQDCWFAENLKNHDVNVLGSEGWAKNINPLRSNLSLQEDNRNYEWEIGFASVPGGPIYNWYFTQLPNACPEGWHISTNEDWNALEAILFNAPPNKLRGQTNQVGGDSAIAVLRAAGFLSKLDVQPELDYPNTSDYTNVSSGAVGLAGGGVRVGVDGTMRENRTALYWWTSDAYPARPTEFNRQAAAWARGVKISPDPQYTNPVNKPWIESTDGLIRTRDLWSTSHNKSNAIGCRCVKDRD
jgi:uncharacterized protein (TIGR02145 family)